MAVRSIALLKAWFKRGLYPTALQFADWMDSYWHKEEQIPISSVDNLSNQLNDKYPKTDGVELERKHDQLVADFQKHEQSNVNDFDGVYNNIKKLKEEDATLHEKDTELQESLTNAHTDLGTIREMIKAGATLAEAKTALIALGTNYKDLYAVAGTLTAFLEANDTVDTTINTWAEIEKFLQGITDTTSLTTLLNTLEIKITENCSIELEKKLDKTDIVNDLVTGGTDKALSAEQGSELFKRIADIDKIGWVPDPDSTYEQVCVGEFHADMKGVKRQVYFRNIREIVEIIPLPSGFNGAQFYVTSLNYPILSIQGFVELEDRYDYIHILPCKPFTTNPVHTGSQFYMAYLEGPFVWLIKDSLTGPGQLVKINASIKYIKIPLE